MSRTEEEFLYIRVSELIESQIRNGLLKTGDRLLSVRGLSREQGISLSTAFKAYCELEARGLIEARPKSGYYVTYTPRSFPGVSEVKAEPRNIKDIDTDAIIALVHESLKNEGIIQLSLSAPSIELLPRAKLNKCMINVIRTSRDSCISYESVQGNNRLRRQIARHAFSWGGDPAEEDIVVTHGCMEALYLCLKAVTRPGDIVAVESPVYFGIFSIMQSLGLKIVEIPSDNSAGIDIGFLRKALDDINIKACLFITNFSNPAGSCMPEEKKKELVELLAGRDIPLIEDDIYGELYFGRNRPHTCKRYDTKGLVLLCSSVSKTLSPGYRIGWCLPGRFKAEVMKEKLNYSITSASPTQSAIAMFLETGRYDLHMRNLRKTLHLQSLKYLQAIAEHFPPDTRVTPPQGGYVLWLELNPRINALELYQKALEHNISIAPGHIFSTDGRFSNFIRISYGQPFTGEMDKSIKILGGLVKALAGAPQPELKANNQGLSE